MKNLPFILLAFLSLTAFATEVTFIPDVHNEQKCRDRDSELRDQARDPKGTLYYAMEGITFEAPAERKHPREIGLETEVPQLFVGYLAYTAYSRQLKKSFKTMTDEEKRFVLSQILVLITYTHETKIYDDVMVPALKKDEDAIPQGKALLALLKPLAQKYPFPDPKDFDKWIEKNQKALEDHADGITAMMLLGANYVLGQAFALDRKLGAQVDFEHAVALMNGGLNQKATARVFAEVDAKLRAPTMNGHLIAAYKEVSDKKAALHVMAGGRHIKPMVLALRKNTDATVIIDDAIIRAIDLTKVDKDLAEEIKAVLAELDEIKKPNKLP